MDKIYHWSRFTPSYKLYWKSLSRRGQHWDSKVSCSDRVLRDLGPACQSKFVVDFLKLRLGKKTERRRKRMKQMARESSLTAFQFWRERNIWFLLWERKKVTQLVALVIIMFLDHAGSVLKFKPLRNLNGWSCTVQMHLELLFSAVDFMWLPGTDDAFSFDNILDRCIRL